MAWDWRSGRGPWDEPDEEGLRERPPAPGKVSLTSRIKPRVQRKAAMAAPPAGLGYLTQPVQRRAGDSAAPAEDPFAMHLLGERSAPGADAASVHAAAAHGVAGPAEALPHHARIQASFGRHDVSGIRAHVGGPAADASAAMGARAFATGPHVAFAEAPDLHTAAHEAAHVVQQAGGVQLAGGVGAEGDVHEQHADRVADKVVAGESAEALLDEVAGARGATAAIVQRKRGDVDASEDAADRSADRYRHQAERKGGEVDARRYVRAYLATHIAPAISAAWRSRRFPLRHPRVEWTEQGRASFAYEVAAKIEEIYGAEPDRGLVALLAPTDLWDLVDKNRMITRQPEAGMAARFFGGKPVPGALQGSAMGPMRWVPDVAVAIRSRLEERILAALPKVLERYVAIHDQKQVVARATGGEARPPGPHEIIPGRPIERPLIRALCVADMVRVTEQARPGDDAAPRRPRVLRSLFWMTEKSMWNWVKVEPADATAEEVAYHLWQDYSAADRLTASPPYFAIRVEDAVKFPEARFNRGRGGEGGNVFDRMQAANESADLSLARAEVARDPAFDPNAQLARSRIATEAAVAQSERVDGAPRPDRARAEAPVAPPVPTEARDAFAPVLTQLQAIARMVAPLGLDGQLADVSARTAARAAQLAMAPAETAPQLARLARLQHAVLLQIGTPLAQLTAPAPRRAGASPGPGPATATAAAGLVRAAAHSDLPETARAELAQALERQRTVATDAMEEMLAEALGRVEALTMDRGQVRGELRAGESLMGSLHARQRALRERVADLRTRLLAGDPAAEAEVKELLVQVDALRFEADVLTNLNAVRGVFETIDALLESDWVLLAGQGMDLATVKAGGRKLRDELRIAHQAWLGAVREARALAGRPGDGRPAEAAALVAARLDGARARLQRLAGEASIRAYLQQAYEEIDDASTRAMIVQIAVYIGVTLVASQVGGAAAVATNAARGVEAGAAGGQIVGALTQSVIVAGFGAATSNQPGDSFGTMFVSDVLATMATLGALGALGETVKGTRMARVLDGLEEASGRARAGYRLLDVTARTLTVGTAQVTAMQMDSVLRTGRSMTGGEMVDNGAMEVAMMITHGVINRLRARPLTHVERLGPRGQELIARHAALEAAALAAEKSPNPEQARKLLAQERALYELEALELRRKIDEIGPGDRKLEAHAAGAEAHRDAVAATQGAEILATAGLDPVIPGRTYAGDAADLDRTAARLREVGFEVRTVADGGQRRVEATSPDGQNVVELVERGPARAPGPRSATGDGATRPGAAGDDARDASPPPAGDTRARPGSRPGAETPAGPRPVDADLGGRLRPDGPDRYVAEAGDLRDLREAWARREGGRVSPIHVDPINGTAQFSVRRGRARLRVVAELPARITSAGELASVANRIVGHPLTSKGAGLQVLRDLNAGRFEALTRVGVEVPTGVTPRTETEFGLGKLQDGRHVIVRGQDFAVDWSQLPGVKAVAHTHPPGLADSLLQHTGKGAPLAALLRPTDVPLFVRELVLPSAPDIVFVGERGIDGHRVITPFTLRDGVVTRLEPGDPSAPLEWVIQGAREVGTAGGARVFRARLVAELDGKVVARTDVWADAPEGGVGNLHMRPPDGLQPGRGAPATAVDQVRGVDASVRGASEPVGDFRGDARTPEQDALSIDTLRTALLNDLALVAPPGSRVVGDRTIELGGGTRVRVDVGDVGGGAVARHERLRDGSYQVTVSARARAVDVTRALAGELASVHRAAVEGDASRSGPPRGLDGRAAEARVLLDNLDRATARGGEHLDRSQLARDLDDLFRSLDVDASPAGRARLAALLGSEPAYLQRASMHLDGMGLRPTLDASSDLAAFDGARHARLAQLGRHATGEHVSRLVATEDLALGAQLRMEEGHRIFDQLGEAAALARKEPGLQSSFRAFQGELVQVLNDGGLRGDRKRALLEARIDRFMEDPATRRLAEVVDIARLKATIQRLGDPDRTRGVMLLDPASGDLRAPGAAGQTGPRSLRELMRQVDLANQTARQNGIAIEYVIVVHRPGAGEGGGEAATVEVLARRRLRSRLPDRSGTTLPDHEGPGDLILDVGVGRGNFAAELAARQEGHLVVQTEHIGAADVGQASRDLPGIADAGPLAFPGAVMVYGDFLSRLDLLRGAIMESDREGIRKLFLNNVSAHYDSEQYRTLAGQLADQMAEGGIVDVQWSMSPETPNGRTGDRGHIEGDRLRDALESTPRTTSSAVAQPIAHDYTLNSSRRGQAQPRDMEKYIAPAPERRVMITFHGALTTRANTGGAPP